MKWINEMRGGVLVGGQRRFLEYEAFDDRSSASVTATIMENICADPSVPFILGPYGTTLNLAAIPVSERYGRLFICHGGATDSIFAKGYKYAVQVQTPASQYHKGVFDLLASVTSTSLHVAFLYENGAFPKAVMAAATLTAVDEGHIVSYEANYPTGVTLPAQVTSYVTALAALSPLPDVLLGGGYYKDGVALTNELAAQGLTLNAVSLLVAPGFAEFHDAVDSSYPGASEGVMTPSRWDPLVAYTQGSAIQDGVSWFSPSTQEYIWQSGQKQVVWPAGVKTANFAYPMK